MRFHAPRAAPARGATSRETEKPTTTRLTDLAWRWWWCAVIVVSLSGEWEPDSEDVLLQAFRVFDPEGNGYIEVRGAAAQGGRARGARVVHTLPPARKKETARQNETTLDQNGAARRRAARAKRRARREELDARARECRPRRGTSLVCLGGPVRRRQRSRARAAAVTRRTGATTISIRAPSARGGRGWSCVTPRHGTRALASNRGASVAPPRAGAGRRRALWSDRGGSRLALAPAVDRGGERSGWRPVPYRRSRLRQLYRGADPHPPPPSSGVAPQPRARDYHAEGESAAS